MRTDEVLELIQRVADQVIVPRFRQLQAGEIEQKQPGDFVTVADRESEQLITDELLARIPGCVVVGEEATFANPGLFDAVSRTELCYVVDPVDGTRNFVEGRPDFAVMITECRSGTPVRCWVWQPEYQRAYLAEAGAGATLNGVAIKARSESPEHPLGATSLGKFFGFDADGALSPVVRSAWCVGIDYPRVLAGELDYLIYKNLKPWDHLPGALLLRETGGVSQRFDGLDYTPDFRGPGLIAAATPEIADAVRRAWGNPFAA